MLDLDKLIAIKVLRFVQRIQFPVFQLPRANKGYCLVIIIPQYLGKDTRPNTSSSEYLFIQNEITVISLL